jgi:hypothetical protein
MLLSWSVSLVVKLFAAWNTISASSYVRGGRMRSKSISNGTPGDYT